VAGQTLAAKAIAPSDKDSDLEPFDRRKARDGFALGLDAEARSAPPGGYDRLRRLAAPPMPPGRKAEVYGADGTVAVWRGV
jgi:hypothetical protein